MKGERRLTIDDLRKCVQQKLPAKGSSVEIPIGKVFPLRIAITVQKEVQARGYVAHCQGSGNGTYLRIECPQTNKNQMAFST